MQQIIIACDFENKTKLQEFLEPFGAEKLFLKIGMELYYKEGNALIQELRQQGHNIFLDLKLHDIPNTVEKSLENLASLDVQYITVHAAGGQKMLEAASRALQHSQTKLLAVTILTSLSQEMVSDELLIQQPIEDIVRSYSLTAKNSGIDGVICSPHEIEIVRAANGPDFDIVTPGIRLATDNVGDQVRVMEPQDAISLGANHLVIGRSITQSPAPYETYLNIKGKL